MELAAETVVRREPVCREPTACLVAEVLAWAMAQGHPVPAEAVRAVLGAAPVDGVWTEDAVDELVWSGVVGWCRHTGHAIPERGAEGLWVYLEYLDATGRLPAGSHELERLLRPLRHWANLGPSGRPVLRDRPRRSRSNTHPRNPREQDAKIVRFPRRTASD